MRQYFEINSKNKAFQNLWDIGKAVFRMMPTALNTCISKEDRYKIIDPSFHFNKSEKEQTLNPKKVNGRKSQREKLVI